MSESPYLRSFDRLDEVHHQMEEAVLTAAMNETGYSLILQKSYPLPNGKTLVRVDFIIESVNGNYYSCKIKKGVDTGEIY